MVKSATGYVYASDRHKCHGSGKTKKEAERAAILARDRYEQTNRASAQSASCSDSITLSALFDRYNDDKRVNRCSDSTLTKYERYHQLWTSLDPDGKGPLGDRNLDNIPHEALSHAIGVLSKDFARNTLRNVQAYLSGALEFAVHNDLVHKNRAKNLKSIKRKLRQVLTFDHGALSAIISESTEDHPMLAAIALGCYGLRIGEACGLTTDDLKGNEIRLSRQLDRVREYGEHGPQGMVRPNGARSLTPDGTCLALTSLKSEAAERSIMVTDEIAKILHRSLDGAVEDVVWDAVEATWVRKLFVVRAPRGKAQETQRLRARFAELCRSAGYAGSTYHLQRAFFATEEARSGLPMKVLSAALGHTSVAVTEMYVQSLLGTDHRVWEGAARRVCTAIEEASKRHAMH